MPFTTASGNGASGGSWERSCWQAKNRTNDLRRNVVASRIVPRSIEHGLLRHRSGHVELDLPADTRERPQVCWQHYADHDSVCTSTETTGGRSRTIGVQVSPESGEPYTWPPVVPK